MTDKDILDMTQITSPRRALFGFLMSFLLALSAMIVPSSVSAVALNELSGKTDTPKKTLDLRSCPAVTCRVLKRIPHGTVLSLTDTSNDWFETTYGGKTGWVDSWYVILQGTPATTHRRGDTSRKMVSYTFDAGSDVGFAGQILDFLRDNNIRASFGMTGKWAEANPTHVQRIADEGHHIINHSWTHDSFTGYSTGTSPLSPARRTTELVTTNNEMVKYTGATTQPYFRPPFGDYDGSVLRDIGANGYGQNVMWNVDSFGWKGLTATEICDRVISLIDSDAYQGNGSILLFHVGAQSQDANALSCITTELTNRGFTFGTVPQVLAP